MISFADGIRPEPAAGPTRTFSLKLLGPPEITGADRVPLEGLPVLGMGLLAYLSVEFRPQPRGHLAGLLWPRAERRRARHSLRQLISTLRASLPGLLVTQGDFVCLNESEFDLDVQRFEDEVRGGRLHAALTLWRGPFMEGWGPPGSWELEDWIDRRQSRLERLIQCSVVEASRVLTHARRLEEAVALLDLAVLVLPEPDELALLRAQALAVACYRPEVEAAAG